MKDLRWQLVFGTFLVLLSAALYFLHFRLFHDAHHIFIYLMGDIAFVPVEVLLVTLIIHRLLERKERQSRMEKTNMVIEVFYSELGNRLLADFSGVDPDTEGLRSGLSSIRNWTGRDFGGFKQSLVHRDYKVDERKVDLSALSALLSGKRGFVLSLWENPNLLEHESFTEVLRATMHLTEELAARKDLEHLPDSDYEHLGGDLTRVYRLLCIQWVDYMRHLKENYPYLFSLAVRTNPFDREASPLVS